MSFSLLPTVILSGITDIQLSQLKKRDIRLLMLDFDNTIVPYTTAVPTEAIQAWIQQMKISDIHLCVVSNSKKDRVKVFCEEYGIACITHARKPSKKGIIQALKRFGIESGHAALVGDQIYTDTLAGNRAGVTTILVPAINKHNIWLKLRHVLEVPFILLAKNRRQL